MRLTTLRLIDGGTSAAVLDGVRWVHLPFRDVGALVRADHWQHRVRDVLRENCYAATPNDRPTGEVAPVVTAPRKILCCGHNYRVHIAEMGRPHPEFPTLFAKFADTLCGPYDPVAVPAATELDWEAELAVVVGAHLRRAGADECRAAIAGYT